MNRFEGFEPVFDDKSRVLILGSFPSVKSRAQGFYYGNPQNRFWKMLCGYFGEEIPQTVAGKIEFLKRNHVALWDMVCSCEIEGSSDASIRGERVADVFSVTERAPIERILCNGAKSYALLTESAQALLEISERLPSTSPANPRYDQAVWYEALDKVFGKKS